MSTTTFTQTTAEVMRDSVIRDAKNLPDLIAGANKFAPDLAASLTEKSLLGSKTAWAPLITGGVSVLVSHYGLGWDDATTGEVSGILTYLVVLAVRCVTRSPIGSLLPK
jgi:hypothetical protein